ncbi:MAG: c-type cytochrome [Bacteroidetes bacterium]|nr:c-type cytochrome [Bacteroidota bacterium]
MMILLAVPIAIFAFFPRLAEQVNKQPWGGSLWMFLIAAGVLAVFIGLDLLNRVDVYKQYVRTADAEKDQFWKTGFIPVRTGFLRTGVVSVLLMAVVLFFMVFYLMILPKAPEGNWYLWVIKLLGAGIALGVLCLLNAVAYLRKGRLVILGMDDTPAEASTQPTWINRMLQIKPTFLDAEVDLKEDFDGITELDNPPPPWFMFMFYGTVLFAGVYLVRYTWLHYAPNQIEEYAADFKAYKASTAAVRAKMADNVDENNVTVETDAAKIADAAAFFKSKCSTCHGEKGQGISGPNLTDGSWLHGNSVKEVFKTIKYGVIEKGMVPWKDNMPASQMKAMATYVLSLGKKPVSPPEGKEPQGEKLEPKEKL